ncbi:MAG: Gfo/Idh/MocA family oxidoreductase [Cyanobacteria bacterium P01_F01_bin.53]
MAIRVGLVGTGYAAKTRAEALLADDRSHLLMVAGRDYNRACNFASRYELQPMSDWAQLVNDTQVDLVVVATVSALHGEVVESALAAGKHVVVEYPLSLDLAQSERLLRLAQLKGVLLHVEHIELLGGLHLSMRSHLSKIGDPYYVNYRTLNPQRPAPKKWTYQEDLFGFPFCGALSRVHRLTNLFGAVKTAECSTYRVRDEVNPVFLSTVVSSGRLQFECGVVAELTYGKGEQLWVACRDVEIYGSSGALVFVRDNGVLTTAAGEQSIDVAPRRGLFVQDTENVLAHLTEGSPLYLSAAESVYALRVADALRQASEIGQTVEVSGLTAD